MLTDLAKISFEGENYEDAYSKYSQLIEQDFNNSEAWVGKALSSAYLAEPDGKKFKETEICLEKASQLGLSDEQRLFIATHIVKSATSLVNKIHSKIKQFLSDKEKKPMATGELVVVRNLETQTNKMAAFNEQWPNYNVALLFAKSSLLYNDLLKHKTDILAIIDSIYYVNDIKFYEGHLWDLRQEIIAAIKSENPQFEVDKPASKEGCFIATAVYGNYDAPEVLELRDFRDNFLKKHEVGRKIIEIYYQHSPHLALRIKNSSFLKHLAYLTVILPAVAIWRVIKHTT